MFNRCDHNMIAALCDICTLRRVKTDLAAAQSTIALIQRIAGGQVDQLVSTVEELVREREELKAAAVRFKIHLEQKDRALAANAEEYRKLKAEFFDYTHETSKLRDQLNEASDETAKALNAGVTWMKEVEALKRERDNYANVPCTCGADDDMLETLDLFHRRGAEAFREAERPLLEELNEAITTMNQRDKRAYVGPEYQKLHGFVHAILSLPIPERATK